MVVLDEAIGFDGSKCVYIRYIHSSGVVCSSFWDEWIGVGDARLLDCPQCVINLKETEIEFITSRGAGEQILQTLKKVKAEIQGYLFDINFPDVLHSLILDCLY